MKAFLEMEPDRYGYLVVERKINSDVPEIKMQSMGNKAYGLYTTLDKAKQAVAKKASYYNTSDSEFGIQPLDRKTMEEGGCFLHAIVHVYLNNDFVPMAELDDGDADGAWFAITYVRYL